MELQELFNAAIAIIMLLSGILLKSIYDAVTDLRRSDGVIHERINALPNIYRRREDSISFESRIEAALIRIESKLDSKADK